MKENHRSLQRQGWIILCTGINKSICLLNFDNLVVYGMVKLEDNDNIIIN